MRNSVTLRLFLVYDLSASDRDACLAELGALLQSNRSCAKAMSSNGKLRPTVWIRRKSTAGKTLTNRCSEDFCAIRRANKSVGPPAANPTITFTVPPAKSRLRQWASNASYQGKSLNR
jgi:hypothetical protein